MNLNQVRNDLQVQNSSIANGEFAIVGGEISGSSVYIGDLDGKVKWRIRSPHSLTMPYITDAGRMLLVEQDLASVPTFSILEIDFSGTKLQCRTLLVTKKYIGFPFKPAGALLGDVMFFAGDYLADRKYNSVPIRNMTILSKGQVLQPAGPAFSTIGPLAQIGDSRFLGTTRDILPSVMASPGQRIDTSKSGGLVLLDVSGGQLSASPVPFDVPLESEVLSVSAFPAFGFSLLKQQDFKGSYARDVFARLDSATLEITDTIEDLDDKFLFGDLVKASKGDSKDSFVAMAQARQNTGDGLNFIATIRDGTVSSTTPIDVSSVAATALPDCDAGEAVFFQ